MNYLDKNTGTWHRFRHEPGNSESLCNDHVEVVFEDSNKRLWVGTDGGGLGLLDLQHKKFTHYFKKDGLPYNSIQGQR